MVRDFTEATKQRLSDEIDDINKSTWSPVTDAIGDVISYAGKWLGIISLKDDMSNVESYQRTVLDMTDTTKNELEEIFKAVYDIDKKYKSKLVEIVDNEKAYNERLKYLFGIIQPHFSICSAATINKGIADYDKKLKATSSKLNSTFEKEVDWAAKRAALEATKGTLNGIIKGVVDFVCLPGNMIKNIVTGNYLGLFTDTWDIIDDFFATCGNIGGLLSIGIGYGLGSLMNNTNMKNEGVRQGEAYGGVDGLTEFLKAEEKINGEGGATTLMRKGSEFIDAVSDICDLTSDAKDFFEDPKKLIDPKFGFKGYSPVKKADMLEKYQDDYRKWQALYRRTVKGNYAVWFKNLSNAKSFLDPFIDTLWGDEDAWKDHGKAPVEKFNKWFKYIGDVYELNEDLNELGG